ncbi:MAG: AsmA family protein, partial [Deltaproteobacteria bacterium]
MKGHTMWKKIIAGVVGFVLLLLGVAIALPFLFKDRIFERLKAEVEARVTARIDFGDFDLSLFSHFPDLTLRIEQIEVHGVGKFEGTTLADIGAVEATIDLGSLLRRPIAVKRIGIVAPKFHVVILEDGSANYDIAVPVGKEAPQGEAPPQPRGKSEGGKELRIALREYFIEDAEVTYEDRPGALYAHIEHFTHRGSGDLSQALVLLRTKTVIGAVTLRSGGIPYLKRTRIEGKFDLRLDLEKKRYAFDENELRLNDFVLGFDGAVALRNDGALDLDVTWKTRRTDFKQILSLVPAVYTQNFANLETAGTVQLEGFAKGILQGEQLPAFGLDLRVADGMFHDPKLPSRVEGVAAKLHVENGGGSADETTVALERFHLEIAKNPVDLKFVLRHPVSDPEIDATLLAHLDLARLGEVIPLKEGESFGGRIDADVTLAGKLSTLQAGRYDAFQADGKVELAGVSYTGPTLPLPLLVEKGRLAFSPKFLELSPFDAKIGHSDLHLTGRIDNYLPFALRDETLRGNFTLTSTLLDVTPFMTGEKETEKAPLSVIEVPRNIDAVFRTRIDTLRAGGIEMTKVRGKVVVRDGVADLHDLGLKIFGGTLLVTGKYDTREPRNPRFDFGLDLKRIDLPTLWQQVETIQKIAPVARNSSGKFSTKLRVTGLLDPQMAPRLDTLT